MVKSFAAVRNVLMLAQADDSVVPKLKEALERRTKRTTHAASHVATHAPIHCICRSAGEVKPRRYLMCGGFSISTTT